MADKEISLLKEQLVKLKDKKFDLEAWKDHTIIYLERIYGANSTKIQMIRDLHYDYSSWHLRDVDVAGAGRSKDPVRTQASEIIEAIIYELEQLGLPKEARINDRLWSLLEDELTGKQIKEVENILNSNPPDKSEKIQEILKTLEKETLASVIVRLLTT